LDGNDYRIRITQSGMPISLYDDSDAPFSIVAAVAPQKFSIADVQGYKTIYSAGEKLGLTVKGIEPDGTPTTPEEGFNVQVVVYNTATNAYVPQTNGNLGGNAQYSNGHWYFNANEALNAGDYYMIVYLYCAYDTKICATKYGRAAQVEKRFDFKVSSATQPSITVTWPQTGYSLDNSGGKDSGLIGNIQWTSSNTNNLPIEIDLLNNSGVIVKYIATYLTNTGSYAWKYDSSIPNGTYKIVVSTQAKEGTPGSAAGQSGYFTLSGAPTQPSITVTAPNGGEQWQKGSSQSVKWNSNNVPYVSVLLNKGQNTVKILADTIANQGFYQWNIPSDLLDGNDYRIRITQSGMPISLYDDSDAPFSITAPTGPADLSSGNQIFLSTVGVGQENILSFDVVNIGGSNFPLTYGSIWTYKDVSPIGEFSQRRIISDTCKLPTNSQLAPGNKCSVQIGVIFNSVGQKALSITLANDQNTQNNVFTITTNVQAVGGNGALVVSLDSSSPPHRIVVAGTTNVELARIKFSASGEAIDLRQVALQLSGTDFNTPNDLVSRRVKLWTADGVQIGEASFPTSDYAISTAIASGAFRVPAGGYKVLVIKGDISPVCISCAVTSPGDLLKVDWDGDNRGINGTYGIGINSGMNITPTGSDTASDGVTIVSATALTPSSSQTASVLDVIKPSWWPTGF
jgi:hypothetical protein